MFGSLVAMFVIWLVEPKCDILLLCYGSTGFSSFWSSHVYVCAGNGCDVGDVKCSQETHVKRAYSHQL